MLRKLFFFVLIAAFVSSFASNSYALGGRQAAASLILPTTGQAMNGELGKTKTKIMAGLEFGLVTTATILGIAGSGGTVLWAALPLVGNHVWSSVDAYKGARRNAARLPSFEMAAPQGDQVQEESGIRERIQRAGTQNDL